MNSSDGYQLQEMHTNLDTKYPCPSLTSAVKATAELPEFTCLGSPPGAGPVPYILHCLSRVPASRDPRAFILIRRTWK